MDFLSCLYIARILNKNNPQRLLNIRGSCSDKLCITWLSINWYVNRCFVVHSFVTRLVTIKLRLYFFECLIYRARSRLGTWSRDPKEDEFVRTDQVRTNYYNSIINLLYFL